MMTRTYRIVFAAATLLSVVIFTGCGGGGGSSSGSGIPTVPQPSPTTTPQAFTVTGSVAQIPVDAYGPVTIAGTTYQSPNAASTTPLAGATVVVGPVPVNGATPPASAPPGDAMVQTQADGTFAATLSVAPTAPGLNDGFVMPQNNVANVQPPAAGYYVEVFGIGSNGQSAGSYVPFHGFRAVTGTAVGVFRLTTTSAKEAAFLALVNSDRAKAGAGALVFDEIAEEVARFHARDEGANPVYYCHYDRANRGPVTRYLAFGGLGLSLENLANVPFASAEAQFIAEGRGGAHYDSLVNSSSIWAGLADFVGSDSSDYVDQEIVGPSTAFTFTGTYPASISCPTGTAVNGS
jgi:uncharacterized protein YkwD